MRSSLEGKRQDLRIYRLMVVDILKDFALVDRREYVPYCPLCATPFTTSSEIRVFGCKHFLCAQCLALLSSQTCPICQDPTEPRNGDFMGDAVMYLSTWMQEAAQGTDKETVIDRLLSEILVVRRNLKCSDLPCRIQAEGRVCTQVFKCPYDHKCQLYHQQPCVLRECPHGDRCLFQHPSVPASQSPAASPAESKKPAPQAGKAGSAKTGKTVQTGKKGPVKAGKPGSKKGGEQACCGLF